MQRDAERTLRNLHILGALSHNDKLMTNEEIFDIYAPTVLRGVVRLWYRERRSCNIERIRETIQGAVAFALKLLDDISTFQKSGQDVAMHHTTSVVQHERICCALRKACPGLENMIQTYKEDAAYTSQLKLMIDEIEHALVVINAPSKDSNDGLRPCLLQNVSPAD